MLACQASAVDPNPTLDHRQGRETDGCEGTNSVSSYFVFVAFNLGSGDGVVLRIEIRLFPSLYLTSYLAPCRSVYPDLYLDLRLRLNLNPHLNLNLNLNLVLYPTPNRTLFLNLFRRLFQRSNPALLDTL